MKKIIKIPLTILLMVITLFVNLTPIKAASDNEVDLTVDMETAFSSWTPISQYSGSTQKYPGQWSYNKANDYVVNAENTANMTGFYNPGTNYSDMDITIKMGSWNSDDDTLGCMIRFSEDSSHNCTGYIFAYDRGGALHGGLYKITGKQFITANCVSLVSFPSVKWRLNTYDTVRIKAEGDNISVWVNGVQVANYTDPDPIESGSYGFFSCSQAQARFTQISGTAYLADYEISFDANGGQITSGNTNQTVTSTKTYGALPTATRYGYIFEGWYTEAEDGYEVKEGDTVKISRDTTLYAHWKGNESKLIINPNGGSFVGASTTLTITGSYEDVISIPAPVRADYIFVGWERTNSYGQLSSLTDSGTYTFGPTADVTDTITATWKKEPYIIETSYTGSSVMSNSCESDGTTSIFIMPANGYETTLLKVDDVTISPVESYNFINVESDHKIEATFTITQTRKMELIKNAYSWINLNLT